MFGARTQQYSQLVKKSETEATEVVSCGCKIYPHDMEAVR